MPLSRKNSLDQLKKVRAIVKKNGGDIADKTTKGEQKLPNLYYMHNPSDVHIDSQEEMMTFGNTEKLNKKSMKNVKTFEQHDIMSTIIKMLKNGQMTQSDAIQTIDNLKMADVFKEDIKKDIKTICRNLKMEDSNVLDEAKMMDILRVGKNIDLGDIAGVINKIEGKYVYLEVGLEIKKIPMIDIFKKYQEINESADSGRSMYSRISNFIKYGIAPFTKEDKINLATANKVVAELIDISDLLKPSEIELSNDNIKVKVAKDNTITLSLDKGYINLSQSTKLFPTESELKKLYDLLIKKAKK